MEEQEKKQKKSKLDLLSAVEGIADLAKNSQLSAEFYKKAARYIKYLGIRLSFTKEQSVMMALFIDMCNDSCIVASDFANVHRCLHFFLKRKVKKMVFDLIYIVVKTYTMQCDEFFKN